MKRFAVCTSACALAVILAGCASQQIDVSSLSPQERQDFLQCRFAVNAATAGMREASILGLEKMGTQNKLLRECLEAKGY